MSFLEQLTDTPAAVVESPAGPPTAPVSTPLEQAVADRDVAAFRQASRDARQQSPSDSRTPSADSSPAASAAPAPSTEGRVEPASEPGSGKGQALKARVAELKSENEQLTAELARRKTLKADLAAIGDSRGTSDARPAASSAAAAPTLAQTVESPNVNAPLLTEEQFFAQFPGAPYGQYAVYAGRYAARSEFASLQQQAVQQRAAQEWVEAVGPVRESLPDYDAVVSSAFVDVPDSPTNTAVANTIQTLKEPAVLHYLGTHREVVDALMQLDPQTAMLHVAYLAGSLRAAHASPPAPRPQTTTAPRPPTTLGQKAADNSGDEEMAAVRAKDVGRFRAEMLRQRIAASRR